MANLTVTAYNSDYSNRPFEQKRDMKDGFRSSGFRMNHWIGQQETWGEEQLRERERMLEEQFLETWPLPKSSYEPSKALPAGHSKIANGVYARTASSTAAKIDLLKCVFDICEIDASELSFEMPLDASEE